MALLELQGVAKHFGAIEALKGVDLSIEPGEVLGLMGDNGAGKSTLVKIIAGNFPPSEGEIGLEGAAAALPQAGRRPRAGHRDRLSGPGPVRQSQRRGERVPRPRAEAQRRAVQDRRLCGHVRARRRAVQGAEVRDPAARSGQADVGRPAPGGGDRPDPAGGRQDRADGRAHGRDQRAPGRRGAGADPAPASTRTSR